MSSCNSLHYVVDPDDPRAPPEEVWAAMSPEERQRVVDSLPSEFEASEAMPPDGDFHFDSKVSARDVLKRYFKRSGRSVYVGCDLPVYYPGESMFSPDIMAVLDVPLHFRDSWVVSAEHKGLDFALEVIWSGRRRKDLVTNVDRYARLGIQEYFVFDRRRARLRAYRLADAERKAGAYRPVLAQGGLYTSQVLGLDLAVENERLRFLSNGGALLETDELVSRLENMMDSVEARLAAAEERAEEEARRAEAEARRAEEEARRAEAAERRAEEEARRLAEALAEIERLKRERS